MRWDVIIAAWLERLLADAPLTSALDGNNVFPASANRPVGIPSVEYLFIGDREEELFNPFQIQVDFWCRGIKLAARVEQRLRLLSHKDTMQELGGEQLWITYLDGRQIEYPADPGVIHKSIDFEFKPFRDKYVSP